MAMHKIMRTKVITCIQPATTCYEGNKMCHGVGASVRMATHQQQGHPQKFSERDSPEGYETRLKHKSNRLCKNCMHSALTAPKETHVAKMNAGLVPVREVLLNRLVPRLRGLNFCLCFETRLPQHLLGAVSWSCPQQKQSARCHEEASRDL